MEKITNKIPTWLACIFMVTISWSLLQGQNTIQILKECGDPIKPRTGIPRDSVRYDTIPSEWKVDYSFKECIPHRLRAVNGGFAPVDSIVCNTKASHIRATGMTNSCIRDTMMCINEIFGTTYTVGDGLSMVFDLEIGDITQLSTFSLRYQINPTKNNVPLAIRNYPPRKFAVDIVVDGVHTFNAVTNHIIDGTFHTTHVDLSAMRAIVAGETVTVYMRPFDTASNNGNHLVEYTDVSIEGICTTILIEECVGATYTPILLDSIRNCDGSGIVSYQVTTRDLCGENYVDTVIYLIAAGPTPVLECPDDITIACGDEIPEFLPVIDASDCFGASVITTTTDTCGMIIQSAVAVDDCGNEYQCSRIITIIDTVPPIIVCVPDRIIEGCDTSALTPPHIAVEENCSDYTIDTFTVFLPDNTGVKWTFVVTDRCGNQDSCSTRVFWDITPPRITSCSKDTVIHCGDMLPVTPPDFRYDTACCSPPLISYQDLSQSTECDSILLRAWIIENECGADTCYETITIVSPPLVVTCPINRTFTCWEEVIYDEPELNGGLCRNTLHVFYSVDTTQEKCATRLKRAWHYSDNCGWEYTCNQTITVQNTGLYALACPQDMTIHCLEDEPDDQPTFLSECDYSVERSRTVTIEPCGYGTITKNWVYTNDCGKVDSCKQVITVQPLEPILSCPPDKTVACLEEVVFDQPTIDQTSCSDETFIYHFVTDTVAQQCGAALTRTWAISGDCGSLFRCSQTITVISGGTLDLTCPPDITVSCNHFDESLNSYGQPEYSSECDYTLQTRIDDQRTDCGGGIVKRYFTLISECGDSIGCMQTITVESPLEAAYIRFPEDRTITMECFDESALTPGVLGDAIIFDFQPCPADLWWKYDDMVFITEGNNICYKIMRRWTVIDDNCFERRTHDQWIMVIDDTPPVIIQTVKDTTRCVWTDQCSAYIELTELVAEDCNGYTVTNSYTSGGANASGEYPIGETEVVFTVTDKCGNATTSVTTVTVKDCKAPQIICIGGLSTTVRACDTTFIRTKSVIVKLSDNCTPRDSIVLSFARDSLVEVLKLTCKDVGLQTYKVYATDLAGNTATCVITIDVQNNANDCWMDADSLLLSGRFIDAVDMSTLVPDVELDVSTTGQFDLIPVLDGTFSVTLANQEQSIYTVKANKYDHALFNVSTLDLVRIQRHLLGIDPFTHAWQVLASDIDGDGTVSAVDLLLLRKIILGRSQFDYGEAWVIIPTDVYDDTQVDSPWHMLDAITTIATPTRNVHQDFIVIKRGNVDMPNVLHAVDRTEIQNRSVEQEAITEQSVTVFPNPFIDMITIQSSQPRHFLRNVRGQQVAELESNQLHNLQYLSPGIYFLQGTNIKIIKIR